MRRVYLLLGGLIGLLVAMAAVTAFALVRANSLTSELSGVWQPAQAAVIALGRGYVDMESAERGFLLTRDPQLLQAYEAGRQDVNDARNRLHLLLVGDSVATEALRAVEDAAVRWQNQSAEPGIAAARNGSLTGAALASAALVGKRLFDEFRARQTVLRGRVDQDSRMRLTARNDAQVAATIVALGAAGLAVLLCAGTIVLLRQSLKVPMQRLIDQVERVAEGEFTHAVHVDGAIEITALSRSVESMRLHILDENAKLQKQVEILALSTPVMEVWDKVLTLPIIGTLDTGRAEQLTQGLLERIATRQAELVILDISGMSNVDTPVVQHLLNTVATAALMGAECVLSGVRPEIAQSMARLNVELGRLHIRSSMKEALVLAMQILRQRAAGADIGDHLPSARSEMVKTSQRREGDQNGSR